MPRSRQILRARKSSISLWRGRWLRAARGRLDLIGLTILALFIAVFLTSTVPYLYQQLFGSSSGYDPYP